jgi:hypothetical protein
MGKVWMGSVSKKDSIFSIPKFFARLSLHGIIGDGRLLSPQDTVVLGLRWGSLVIFFGPNFKHIGLF